METTKFNTSNLRGLNFVIAFICLMSFVILSTLVYDDVATARIKSLNNKNMLRDYQILIDNDSFYVYKLKRYIGAVHYQNRTGITDLIVLDYFRQKD